MSKTVTSTPKKQTKIKTAFETETLISELVQDLPPRNVQRLRMALTLARFQALSQSTSTGRKRAAIDVDYAARVLGLVGSE